MLLVSLIGDQPIPNLLPIRHLEPSSVLLVHSERTRKAAERLVSLLPDDCAAVYCEVAPFDVLACQSSLEEAIGSSAGQDDLILNLTGGTKPMALGAYNVAATRRAPIVYLQSEGNETRLFRYGFDAAGRLKPGESYLLPELFGLQDYLTAYLGEGYQVTGVRRGQRGAAFEEAMREALASVVDELLCGVKAHGGQVDVDMVVRCGNQVGIVEAKDEGISRKGIDQLNTAGEQRFLGTYTARILASSHPWPAHYALSRLAQAHAITLVELPSFTGAHPYLSPEDVTRVQRTVCERLGRKVA